ncbi:unnamed protein product, partial [Amoebophrya sp. A25]
GQLTCLRLPQVGGLFRGLAPGCIPPKTECKWSKRKGEIKEEEPTENLQHFES